MLRLSRGAKEEDDSQWVNDPLDDDVYCLDIEGSCRRPSDDQVWLKIKDKTGVTNSTSFQQLDENKRIEMFLELKDSGASLRATGAPDRYRKRSDSPHLVRRTLTCPLCPHQNGTSHRFLK